MLKLKHFKLFGFLIFFVYDPGQQGLWFSLLKNGAALGFYSILDLFPNI